MYDYPDDIKKVRQFHNRTAWRDACISAAKTHGNGSWQFENIDRHHSQCWSAGKLIGDWSLGDGWTLSR